MGATRCCRRPRCIRRSRSSIRAIRISARSTGCRCSPTISRTARWSTAPPPRTGRGWIWCTRRSRSPPTASTFADCTGLRAGDPIDAAGRAGQFCREQARRRHRRHLRHDRHAYRAGFHRARRPYPRRLRPARGRRGVVSAIDRHSGSADEILRGRSEDRSMNRNDGVLSRAVPALLLLLIAAAGVAGGRPDCARPRCWRRRSPPARCRRSRRACRLCRMSLRKSRRSAAPAASCGC